MSRFNQDFHNLGKLGKGGYGFVYRARHKLDEQEYAVKMVALSGRNSTTRQMAVREAKIMAALNHPHIARYHQVWVDTCLNDYCKGSSSEESGEELSKDKFVEEFVEESGDELAEDESEDESVEESGDEYGDESGEEDSGGEDEDDGKFVCIQMELYPSGLDIILTPSEYVYQEERACNYFRQILHAVNHLHELQIVHRDLKPSNILIDRDDRIRVADFGLAKYIVNLEGEPNESVDHIYRPYDAPEMGNRKTLTNEKVDIYSLGIIWFELCKPFNTESERQVMIKKLKEGELDASWLDTFQYKSWLVGKMMADEPSARPSAGHILEMLDA